MKLLSCFITMVVLLTNLASAQDKVSGVVYHDQNGNSRQDQGEPGIASVAVSNGKDVELTDKTGRYELPVGGDTIVFVIKPSGYELPVNDRNLPQFYYIHKPEGSPELKYHGVDPTGPLPESVDFALLSGQHDSTFSALVFGDPQPYTRQEVRYFDQDIVSELQGTQKHALGISLGDLVGDDLNLFDPYIQSLARLGIPWLNVFGNHDMNFDVERDYLSDETFEATFGPATYAYNHGEVHFIILDDVIYPRSDGRRGYVGGLTQRQLKFIENDLKHVPKNKLVVVAFHIPPFSDRSGGRTFRPADRDQLFDLLDEFPHTLSLSAHTHIQQILFYGREDGWHGKNGHVHYNVGTTSGDWWSGEPDERGIPATLMRDGTPNGYAIINFRGNAFTFDYKVAGAGADQKMSIWGPRVVPQDSWHGAELYVNYYLGSEKTRVEYKVGDNEWRLMQKTEEADPAVARLRQKWDTADEVLQGKRPSNPVASPHLWKTHVPNDLPVGEQVIRIRVTDMFGRVFMDEFAYEVVEK